MKVAILSDIHANIFALKVLTEIKELKINKIFIAGDLQVTILARNSKYIEQFDIFAIKGNQRPTI